MGVRRIDAVPVGRHHYAILLRCHVNVNYIITTVIRVLSESGGTSTGIRWTLGLSVLASVAILVRWLRLSSRDLQVCYWLGDLPTITFMFLLVSLTLLTGGCAYAIHILKFRNHQMELRRMYGQSHYREVHYSCYFSLATIRILLVAVTVLAIVAMALAAVVMVAASTLSRSLAPTSHGGLCGLGGVSEAIELAHRKLFHFHHACLEDPVNKDKLVYQCPGFADAFPEFPESQPYAHYLAVTEREHQCSGFCHVSARTLFVPHQLDDAGSVVMPQLAMHTLPRMRAGMLQVARGAEIERSTCGASVGDYLWTWALRVGIWSFVLGPILVVCGIALFTYDDL